MIGQVIVFARDQKFGQGIVVDDTAMSGFIIEVLSRTGFRTVFADTEHRVVPPEEWTDWICAKLMELKLTGEIA